jgi:hypothetical protein
VYPQRPFSGPAPAGANGGPYPAAGHGAGGGRPARSAGLARLGFTGVLVAALGLGAVACGGSSSSGAGGSSSPAASAPAAGSGRAAGLQGRIYQYLNSLSASKKTAFVTCMRSHGEPSFPSSLTLSALRSAGITLRSSDFRSAFISCKSSLIK